MQISIPKEKALKKLSDRLYEVKQLNYTQAEAWKSRANVDVQDIFPILDSRHFQINRLFFGTQYVEPIFNKAKNDAIGFMTGYIEWIKENIADPKPLEEVSIEQENFQLTVENAKLKKQVYGVIQQLEIVQNDNQNILKSSSQKELRIKELESSFLQLENFRLVDVLRIIRALPIKDVVYILGIIAAIIGAIYGIIYFDLTHAIIQSKK